MGYQPRIKSPKGAIHSNKKPLRERRRDNKRINRRTSRSLPEDKIPSTEKEVSQTTLKRLHTLGSQRFGSSPFSEHFDRWLTNVAIVLGEFESHPDIRVDDQFVNERSKAIALIKIQLENRRRKENSVDQELKNLSAWRARLKQINTEYAKVTNEIKVRKKSQLKRLYKSIDSLRKEQETIILAKAGLFRSLSKKAKEQKEIEIAQKLSEKQRELELVILEFKVTQNQLQDECDRKKEPVTKQIKLFQKKVDDLEYDNSLEERWFACEALIDAVITFLQRKTTQPSEKTN
jgi:hypothetical protein